MKKSDPAHIATDEEIAKIEKLITKEYKKAHKEVSKKCEDYFAKFAAKDAKWQEWVAQGTKTQKEYKEWRQGQMLVGKKWEDLRDTLAQDYTNAAQITMSITKGFAPEVYAINHNYATFQVEKGAGLDTSYALYSKESVEYMYKGKPKLYHTYGKAVAKEIKEGKQYAWDRRRITSVLTQAILQGKSIPNITKSLEQVTAGDHKAAIRNARTMMTGVQNAGRIDAMERAADKGIPVQKQWLATLDMRTRHWHKALDGAIVDYDKPFHNEFGDIMFPGDPDADGSNVYNCFVGDTKIATDSNIVRSYKHDYSGQLFTIKSASGIEFTCTPNHPILTASGWVAAERLKYGDNLLIASVRENSFLRVNPDIDHTFACIDAIHDFLNMAGGKRATSEMVNFHGDIPASDVEIITQKWFLGSDWNTSGSNSVDKFLLKHANKTFMGKSAFVKHFGRIGFASLGFVSGLSKAFAFVFRGMRHAIIHCFRTIAGRNSRIFKTQADNMTSDTKLFCDGFDRSTSGILTDYIVDIKVSSVSHIPVYNLQTLNGYYFVNTNIPQNEAKYNGKMAIAKNCRCTLLPAIKGYALDVTDPSVRPNDKLGKMTYEEWLAEKKSISNPITLPEEKAATIQGAWWKKYGGGAAKEHKFTGAEGKALADKYEKQELAKEFKNIWSNKTVNAADYPNMKKDVTDKKWNLNKQLDKANAKGDAAAIAKYQAQMDELLEFEKQGKKYLELNPDKAKGAVKKTAKAVKSAEKASEAPKVAKVAKAEKTAEKANKAATAASEPKPTPKPKKLTEKEAVKAVEDAEKKVKSLLENEYVNIWAEPVTPADYTKKKAGIPAKRQYFQDKLDEAVTNGWQSKIDKFTALLDDLAEFEMVGKDFELAKAELDAAKKAYEPFIVKKEAKLKPKIDALKKDLATYASDEYDMSNVYWALNDKVKVEDYPSIKKKITSAKKSVKSDIDTYDFWLNRATTPEQKVRWQKKLDEAHEKLKKLEQYEEAGKKYAKIQKDLEKVEKKLAGLRMPEPDLSGGAYSQARKNAALWAKTNAEYQKNDAIFDKLAKEVHSKKSAFEHQGYYHYTWGSGPFNQPLAGFKNGWGGTFVGPGKLDIDVGGYGSRIRGLTQLCEKSKYDFDFWCQSGQSQATLEGFLKIPYGSLRNMTDAQLQQFVGAQKEIPQFVSGAINKGGGSYTPGDMLFNIYCPKGSEALYVRGDGYFGKSEHEIILQRGGTYKITRIYWGQDTVHGGRKLIVDLELRVERGYNKFQQ